MLEIDQDKRANIDDIINSDWVTDHGDEILCLNHKIEDDNKSELGNINRKLTIDKI